MSIPAQNEVAHRSSAVTDARLSRSAIDTDDSSLRFEAVFGQSGHEKFPKGQSLAHKRERLEGDLARFRNGEISASELEASMVAFEIALQDAGIETNGMVENDQLIFPVATTSQFESYLSMVDSPLDSEQTGPKNSTIAFASMNEQQQRSTVQNYLDNHDPIQFYGEQLAQTLADFHGQRATGQELEQAIVNFVENLSATGVHLPGSVDDGEFIWRNPQALERIRPNPNEPPPRLDNPFSWLEREQQASVAESILRDYLYESPDALRAQQHNLAADLVVEYLGVSDDPDLAAQIGAQSAQVAALAESFSQNETPTDAERDRLVEETGKLVALYQAAGIHNDAWHYDAETGDIWFGDNNLFENFAQSISNGQPLEAWDQHEPVPMSALDNNTLSSYAAEVAGTATDMASMLSLDHQDILGGPAPNLVMEGLQYAISQAQVPDDVDAEMIFQYSYAAAQLSRAEGDLKNYEYRLIEAVTARLGDKGWGLTRDTLWAALRWINGITETSLSSVFDVPHEESTFLNAWESSSRETRIEYLGFDVATWNEVEPLLVQALNAHNERKSGEYDVADVFRLGFAMFASYLTAGALTPAVTSFLGGSAVAGAVGAAAGGAAGSMVSSLIITGDWVTARETFKEIFEGDLKEGLADVALSYVGLDSRYSAILNSATSDEAVDALTEELGLELVQKFGAPFIEGLKAYTPDVVDNYLTDLKKVLLATDDPDTIAEHAIGWWGAELSSMLGVTNQDGIHLVTSLLDTAVTSGDFDIGALQEFLGQEVVEYLADVPAEVVERLGGTDSTLALLGGIAAQLVVNNLDTAIEGDSFIDAAREEFEAFVTDLAENWVDQGGLESALSWIPGAANWSSQFSDLVQFGKDNGWDKDELQAHLSESSLFTNLINSYIPGGVAHNLLTSAIQYASANGLDTQTILNAATVDMVKILGSAGISQDVVNFLGGNGAMLSQMSNVFGERLIANNGDLDATLRDMEKYARGLAAGHVGGFAQSMLAQVLGPGAGGAIEAVSGLAEGVAAGWSDEKIDAYIDAQILAPLGDEASAVVMGAFGGKDNFVGGLLGSVTDAYVTGGGDESAAQGAATDYLMSRLAALVGGAQTQLPVLGSGVSAAVDAVSGLAEGVAAGWSDEEIATYIDEQILSPLGDVAGATVAGAFGGKDNFVGGLLGAITDAYVTSPGDEAAARGAAIDYLMSSLTGLLGGPQSQPASGSQTQPVADVLLGAASPFSLAQSVSQLIEFARDNNWDDQAIAGYVESQFLENGLAGNLIDTLFGGLGTRAQLSAVLVEELISIYQESGEPEAIIEGFVNFILNPPALPDANGTDEPRSQS